MPSDTKNPAQRSKEALKAELGALQCIAASNAENNHNLSQEQQQRTKEGLTRAELALSYALTDAIDAVRTPKPSLIEMAAWADRQESIARASAYNVAMLNGGVINPAHPRQLAVARGTLDFLGLCIEHEADLATFFRAKAHKARRRG